jgi:RNA polymerase sigma-70 factor, ECF subfamily
MLAMQAIEPDSAGPLAADDGGSFRRFYDEALPLVYGYLVRRCGGSAATAEDLTQETFLAAVAELRKGRRVEAPVPWVLGIARHKLLDHYRRQSRRERTIELDDEHELVSSVPDVDDVAVAALARVPASQRAALVLRHLDGFSVPECATALGRSIEAVESLLVRGRTSFRRAYAEVNG